MGLGRGPEFSFSCKKQMVYVVELYTKLLCVNYNETYQFSVVKLFASYFFHKTVVP